MKLQPLLVHLPPCATLHVADQGLSVPGYELCQLRLPIERLLYRILELARSVAYPIIHRLPDTVILIGRTTKRGAYLNHVVRLWTGGDGVIASRKA